VYAGFATKVGTREIVRVDWLEEEDKIKKTYN
jgi:hypothetical protein